MTPTVQDIYKREQKLMHVVHRMETRGVRIDDKLIPEIREYYEVIKAENQKVIVDAAGKDFNPRSPKQMTGLFFGELGHTPLEYSTKGKSRVYVDCQHCKGDGCEVCQGTGRNPKCGGDFLEHIGIEELDNGSRVPKDKLAWALLHNSACDNMLQITNQISDLLTYEDGIAILRPNYRQVGTKTGRLSCAKPNLQAIASDDSGKKRVDIQYRPRELFIPREGFMFYVPDFSQIEVWVLALVSGAKNMVKMLAGGGDAHQIVADMVYPDAYDKTRATKAEGMSSKKLAENPKAKEALKIKKKIRKIIKALNFGLIYGQGDKLTAVSLGVPVEEAKTFKKRYFDVFPEVKLFMSKTIAAVQRDGYVISPYGRKYVVDKKQAYTATNYNTQGPAADVLKDGMVEVDRLAYEEYPEQMFPLLTIHDELIVEVAIEAHSNETMKAVALAMAVDYEFLGCPIPFPVGMKIATERWSESREIMI